MRARCLLLCLGILTGAVAAPVAQERTSTLTGVLRDESGGFLPGAMVIVTNNATGRVVRVVTNSAGLYRTEVEPGTYSLRFELARFASTEITGVTVLLGRTYVIDGTMKVGAVTEAVEVAGEAAPQIDIRTTAVTHNVIGEELDRLPKTRSFQSIALTAPSVNAGEIEGGFQVNGASGAENTFTVDGVLTNSLIDGRSRQNTIFEYLQEVQVKTTGIPAEYGGALGGVISAVTKSGGNTTHGEAHYYYEGSALSTAPVMRLVLSPADETTVSYVQDKEQPDHRNELGGSVGGPIIRSRLFYFGSYSPRLNHSRNTYLFSDGADPGEIKRTQLLTQAFGKITYSRDRITASASLLFTPASSKGTLPAYNGAAPNVISSSKAGNEVNLERGFETTQLNTSGTADISLTDSSVLTMRVGQFRDSYRDTGIPNTASYTYQTSSIGLQGVPPDLQGPVGTQNTPRALIVNKDATLRTFFNADYNHTFSAGGLHTLKGGFGFQRTVNDADQAYPGGYVFIYWDRDFVFQGNRGRGTHGYYEVNNSGVQGLAGANIISLYVQDQWTIGDRLTLNVGLRTENETIPSFRTAKNAFQFGLRDKLAPRLGAAYDVRGDASFKVYGSWGRYFDWTKYELSRGSYGADTWQIYYRGLDTLDLGSLSLNNMPGPDLWIAPGSYRDRRVPNFDSTDPNIKPMYQDGASVGIDYELSKTTVFGARWVHNDLRQTIEDMGAIDAYGDEAYIIGNPGEGAATIQFPSGATPLGQPVPKAKRQYDALELTLNRRFANRWFASASYVFSRLHGNYSGIAASEEIRTPTTGVSARTAQQQAGSIARPGGNANRAWDIDEIMWDSHGNLDVAGRLPTDRPHVVKLYGSYALPFGTQLGLFFYGGSGTPLTTYVTSTNQTELFVKGRGDMGRTPMLMRADLLVSHDKRLANNRRVRLELNVLNVFNQKTARHLFNYLNRGAGTARPSSSIDLSRVDLTRGYDYNAMSRATPDGLHAYDPRYEMADLFNDGAQAYVTVKYIF